MTVLLRRTALTLSFLVCLGSVAAQDEHPVWKVAQERRDTDRSPELATLDTNTTVLGDFRSEPFIDGPRIRIRLHPWRWTPREALERANLIDVFGIIDLLDGR